MFSPDGHKGTQIPLLGGRNHWAGTRCSPGFVCLCGVRESGFAGALLGVMCACVVCFEEFGGEHAAQEEAEQ